MNPYFDPTLFAHQAPGAFQRWIIIVRGRGIVFHISHFRTLFGSCSMQSPRCATLGISCSYDVPSSGKKETCPA